MKEIVRQKSHLQPGLVGFKAMATCFAPAQSILALLDPVFYLCPAIVDLVDRSRGIIQVNILLDFIEQTSF